MKEVKIKTTDLIDKISKNLEQHILDYNEACKDYNEAIKTLSSNNKYIAYDDDLSVEEKYNKMKKFPSPPQSYVEEYETAREMALMSCDLEVVLSEQEFKQLILDQWHWKDSFLLSNAMYKTMI